MNNNFRVRYGPWAVVAGASVGLGAEFATQLAAQGLNLVLIARRTELLDALAAKLKAEYGIQTRTLALDLTSENAAAEIIERTSDLEIGLLVYNAGLSLVGPFFGRALEDHLREVNINCRTPLMLVYTLGAKMLARKRGGILLLSSLSALQGSAFISNYTATKAYELILAEGLWEELRREGIDVLAVMPGAVSTPHSLEDGRNGGVPPSSPHAVATAALAALGKGPRVVPGFGYRLSGFVMQRLLPRKLALGIIGHMMREMYANEK